MLFAQAYYTNIEKIIPTREIIIDVMSNTQSQICSVIQSLREKCFKSNSRFDLFLKNFLNKILVVFVLTLLHVSIMFARSAAKEKNSLRKSVVNSFGDLNRVIQNRIARIGKECIVTSRVLYFFRIT